MGRERGGGRDKNFVEFPGGGYGGRCPYRGEREWGKNGEEVEIALFGGASASDEETGEGEGGARWREEERAMEAAEGGVSGGFGREPRGGGAQR